MPRSHNKVTSFSKISIFMACVALVGYVGYLVAAQYRAQVALQESRRHQLAQEFDRRANATGYFFSAQTSGLTDLAESREIAIYFENLALGMSLEYGLNASLAAIQERFETFYQKNRLDQHPVYTRLLFLTPDGRPLAQSGHHAGTDGRTEWSRFVRRGSRTYFLTDNRSPARIIISVPCIFKEKVVGQVIGEIATSLVYEHFIGNRDGSPEAVALVMGEQYLYLPAAEQALLPPPLRTAPPRLPPGTLTPLAAAGEPRRDLLATKTDIAGTPLSIVNFIPADRDGRDDPGRILAVTAAMALVILSGIFVLFTLTTRNTILKTRLEEAALREQEMEELNRTLEGRVQEEIEKRREKEMMILQNEKLASIGQLAAGVAHEINNPMGFISSNLRTLATYYSAMRTFIEAQRTALEQTAPPELRQALASTEEELDLQYILEDGEELVSESLEGSRRVARIVSDLKNFSRIDAPEYEDANLTDCLESALTIVTNELKYTATVINETRPLPPVPCHPGQMNQVFMNLLINAGQAVTPPGIITLKSWHDDESVSVAVSDNGHGIPELIRDRIFDPFFTTKEVGKGTGLGLSITREIITRHNGEILVESSDRGTTFTVRLPRLQEACP